MPSEWYDQMREVGQHLLTSFRHERKVRYITLCQCGDLHSATSKESVRYHISSHQYGNSFYEEKHNMQTFKEYDIW